MDHTRCHNGFLKEHICSFALPGRLTQSWMRESADELPEAIYPQVRIITADKITQNCTLYPAESLRKGLPTFVRPYAIPFIQDHNTSGGLFGGESSEVFGRMAKTPALVTEGKASYVQGIFRITHPTAVRAILTGEWLTVSLGSRCETVTCSICGQDLTDAWCDHCRGEKYKVGKKEQVAAWVIGPIRAKEVSAVITPSDDEAGVQIPDTKSQTESARALKCSGRQECGTGSVDRVVIGRGGRLFDLVSGAQLSESFFLPETVAPRCGNFHFLGF
jgi:hypothetical protein